MKRALTIMAVIVLSFGQAEPVIAREVFRAGLNHKRQSLGLHALDRNKNLRVKARAHAEAMALAGRISHSGFSSRMRHDGLRDHGEVVAFTGGVIVRPRLVLRLWLNSPPHRSILLSPGARVMGVAAVRHRGSVYWCAITARR